MLKIGKPGNSDSGLENIVMMWHVVMNHDFDSNKQLQSDEDYDLHYIFDKNHNKLNKRDRRRGCTRPYFVLNAPKAWSGKSHMNKILY